MDSKTISSWIRQARYRANKRGIHNDLQISDVLQLLQKFNGKCAYCDPSKECWWSDADALDHPFPLSDTTPNVPANVVPCCKEIKDIKKNNDLSWLLSSGAITQDTYIEIIKLMLQNRGGDSIKEHIKSITGIE